MKTRILLLIPILLAGCDKRQEELTAEARSSYDQIKTTNNSGALFRVAESMRQTGNLEVASKTYTQAIQIDPTLTPAYLGLSQCLRLGNRPKAALQTLNSMPKELRDVSWYKELGAVETAAQKPKACIDAYNKAYEMDSSDAGTLNGIAVCHDLMGQHLEAQKWYTQAMALSPLDSNLKSNYGLSLALSSKPQEAIKVLHEVVESEASTTRDRQNLAVAYGLAGDMNTAAKLFSQDLSQSEVRQNLAFIHKLANTQHLMSTPKNATKATPAFETKLADNNTVQPAPQQAQEGQSTDNTGSEGMAFNTTAAEESDPAATIGAPQAQASLQPQEAVSTDSHVVVQPLPTKESYHDAPIPSIVQQVREEVKGSSDHGVEHEDEALNFTADDTEIADKPSDDKEKKMMDRGTGKSGKGLSNKSAKNPVSKPTHKNPTPKAPTVKKETVKKSTVKKVEAKKTTAKKPQVKKDNKKHPQ